MILSGSLSQSRCQSNCVVDDVSSDWKNLYNSQLWSNSALRREIISRPFTENKAIKCCYTCRGKIRNYEIKSPCESFVPDTHSTPNGNKTFRKDSIHSVHDKSEVHLRCTSSDSLTVVAQEGNEADDRSIPSISRQVDKSFRQKYTSAAYNSSTNINLEQRRLRKSLKGIRCIFRVALTESPTKKRTQIKACSISVMIVAIVMISLVLVNFSTPSLLRGMNKTSTTVVPILNIAINETSSAIVSINTNPSTTEIIDVTQSYTTEESSIFITPSTTSSQVVSSVISKIRKNIKTYPKIKSNHSDGTKDIGINRDLSQKFCSCQSNEVCMLDEDTGTSICKIAADIEDPTGCGGLCALETEACQLVDKERGIRVCRLITFETCSPQDWRCRNGLCVPSMARCDGSIQCYDRSDEKQCDCDLTKEFRCGHSLSCFPNKKICDGVIDCWDGFDEVNCTMECPEGQSPCNDGQCIKSTRFCDGFSDCTDGSDEPQGCDGACGTHELRCMNRRCVPQLSQCDGRDDCGDNTDEMHCP